MISDPSGLGEKLRKVEALFAGAGTEGERLAAGAALARLRWRLSAQRRSQPAVEMEFTMRAPWTQRLFLALCRRYDLHPFRTGQGRSDTVKLKAPKAFVDQVLWPEFEELNDALGQYLFAAALKVIREEIHPDADDAPEVLTAPAPSRLRASSR